MDCTAPNSIERYRLPGNIPICPFCNPSRITLQEVRLDVRFAARSRRTHPICPIFSSHVICSNNASVRCRGDCVAFAYVAPSLALSCGDDVSAAKAVARMLVTFSAETITDAIGTWSILSTNVLSTE